MRALPEKSVDVVLTDPAYSEHVHTRSRRGCIEVEEGTGRAAFNRNRELGFEPLDDTTRENAAAQFARLVRRWVLVFSDTESSHLWRESLERHGLEYVRTLFWRKVGGTPQFTGDRPGIACEAITAAHPPGAKRWNGGGRQGWYDEPIMLDRAGNGARIHSAQKPPGLIAALISDFTDFGDLVLDAFAGSGEVLVQCKRLGRRVVGWERGWATLTDEEKELPAEQQATILEKRKLENFEKARKRIEAAREQYTLGLRPPKPKQHKLGGM